MISREELYELVWSQPMTKVGEQFKVSGSYLARVCSELHVPRPDRGYWAKLEAGKAVRKIPLPPAQPGDPLGWAQGGGPVPIQTEMPTAADLVHSRPTKVAKHTHRLVHGAKTHFESGRPIKDGEYLKPFKKLLVDVTSSKASLDKALQFASDLFNALEAAGHRVVLGSYHDGLRRCDIDENEAPKKQGHYRYPSIWTPGQPTVTYVGAIAIGLAIVELSQEVTMRNLGSGKRIREEDFLKQKTQPRDPFSYTYTEDLRTGRLRLIAYSPYEGVAWSMRWDEIGSKSLTRELPTIVRSIGEGGIEMIEKLESAQKEAEIRAEEWRAQQRKWRRDEHERKLEESIKASRAQLIQIIQSWAETVRIEHFFQEAEARAANLPQETRDLAMNRLDLARNFLGARDPLDYMLAWQSPQERYRPPADLNGEQ